MVDYLNECVAPDSKVHLCLVGAEGLEPPASSL